MAVLAAAVAAFFVVPVAQAAAAPTTVKVNVVGSGSGEVLSHPGIPGEPPIACNYAGKGPGTATGVCENVMTDPNETETEEEVLLLAEAAAGSKFVEWTVQEGNVYEGCGTGTSCWLYEEPFEAGGSAKVTALFCLEGESKAQCLAPHFPLKVTHEGTGTGTIQSSPAGITCTTGTCEASFLEGSLVTLTASPGTNSAFTSWKGCGTVEGRVCKVTMSAAKEVKAKFSPTFDVTVKKTTGATGLGSISGVTCDANCTAATASFAVGKTATLAPKASKGSEFTEWSSCPGTIEGSNCKLTSAGTAEAKFSLIPQFKLTLKKSGGGQGTVKSSPASISCGTSCSTETSLFYKEASVVLTATVTTGKGSAFTGWTVAGSPGACPGTGTCTVTMSAAKEVTAAFE